MTVTNSGDAATSAPIVLTDTLQAPHLALSALTPGPHFSCSGDGSLATPLSCTRAEPLGPGQSDSIQLDVAVAVGGNYDHNTGQDIATSTVTVSGGGVAGVVSTSDPVSVYPRYALEFFLARTTTDDSEATNDTVAGGHPSQTLNAFQFTHSSSGGPNPTICSAEDLKNAYVELPLGFIGNPAAAPLGAQVGEIASRSAPTVLEAELGPGGTLPYSTSNPTTALPLSSFSKCHNTSIPNVLKAVLHPRTESYAISVGATGQWLDQLCGSLPSEPASSGSLPNTGDPVPEVPFLSNPLDCSEAEPAWKLASQTPGRTRAPSASAASPTSAIRPGTGRPKRPRRSPAATTRSSPPSSTPATIATKPLQGGGPVQADSPSGLAVDLDFPQSNDPTDPNTTYRPLDPPGPRAQGHHRQAAGRPRRSRPSSADGLERLL